MTLSDGAMETTSPEAPYDVFRAVRCMGSSLSDPRFDCNQRHGDIDWNSPQTTKWRCKKCKTSNVVRIIAALCEAPCCQTS